MFRYLNRFILGVILMALLSSCSHVSRRDGPPNFYVDETKIPNAVPKKEPLAKYGNMRSYTVRGKRYYVMKSPKHYNSVGIASWYGTKFHARRTSSGERYNMLGMTAAHKTLPLPTYVEVTNLKNHRKIIVKVNDRGPFADGRIIDLTYVAAKKLGMIGRGTTFVRVKAIDPLTYGKPIVLAKHKNTTSHATLVASRTPIDTAAISVNKFHQPVYIQAGAFREKSRAVKLQQRLRNLVAVPIVIHQPAIEGGLYRVKVGPIHDLNVAHKISLRLKALGMNTNKFVGA